MKLLLPLLVVILSIIGIADSSYLTYEKFAGITPPCTVGFQCGTVLTSKYAMIGPVPLSVLGLLYYLTIFMVAILHFIEFDFSKVAILKGTLLRKSSPMDLLQLITICGLLFSVYLIFLMGVVIQAWCLYCLVSAGTSALLFLVTQIYVASYTEKSGYITKTIFHSFIGFLYKWILKPLFFLNDPETVHNTMTSIGIFFGQLSLTKALNSAVFAYYDPALQVKRDGITFANPVGLSAGFDYNGELTQILPSVGFGWHSIGTITLESYAGNQPPRLGRFPKSKALLVNKGLRNNGAREVISRLKPLQFEIPVGVSIASSNKEFTDTKEQILDIIGCFTLFERSKVKHAYYELNISCPNTFGGEPFTTPKRLKVLLQALDKLKIKRPIYVKMPIDQSETETLELLNVIDKHSIAGVILGNLTKDKTNPAVHPEDAAAWKSKKGNLSGKPTFERSNRLIKLTKKHFKNRFTIVGTGGIFSAEDAQLKLKLGADLVQLITGMIYQGPQLIGSINRNLRD